jgi:hypothetical protein
MGIWVDLGVCLGHPLDLPPPQLYRPWGNSRDRVEIGVQLRELLKKQSKVRKMMIQLKIKIKKVLRIPRIKPRVWQISWIRMRNSYQLKKMLLKMAVMMKRFVILLLKKQQLMHAIIANKLLNSTLDMVCETNA